MTADLQARRRLGLTATLVREDGREGDVFSLIGPKRFDAPWKDIEAQGYIAPADCVEVRVTLPDAERMAYAMAEAEDRYRLGSTSDSKNAVVQAARRPAPGRADPGHRPVPRPARRRSAERLDADRDHGRDHGRRARRSCSRRSAPARSGCSSSARSRTSRSTCPRPPSPSRCRARSAPARRRPSASAGCCGPRATGAPRTSTRWSRATPSTPDFAAHRQRFLAEQGYAYRIVDADDVLRPADPAGPSEPSDTV